jgi:hypothetical protein
MYIPAVNIQDFGHFPQYEYDKRSVSKGESELYLSETLPKGKTYALWSGKSYWLFAVE